MKCENFCKEIIGGEAHFLLPPPHNFVTPDGRTIINFHLNPDAMLQYGWREWTDEELNAWHGKYDPPVPETILRFSKLKIMEFLGEKWSAAKEKLMAEGVWDYWQNAAYLSTDHPVFQRFYHTLSAEEKEALAAECRWE